ncbi:hypothetical protein Pmani_015061 [Petrolisthes manimaculis]|uniref:PHD-type domain-containing protein n=1 Tax=Petrolisthes manimaculis TaxID=1843537 RepID=A0AAE1PRP4_9EUCA|nr:hypothetical protein Pmani_015061 [Petrolisthes manimaculis]
MAGGRDLEKKKCGGCGQFARLDDNMRCKECEEMAEEQASDGFPRLLDEKEGKKNDCGQCKKKVLHNQRGLQCELCDWWYHTGCQKVVIEEYNMYKEQKVKAKWFCHKCNTYFKNLKKVNKDMKDENIALKMAYNDKEEENLALRRTNKITEEENIILKEDNKQLINQIRSLEDRMDNLKVQLKKEIIEEIYEEFEEREMKEKKKNNLIIFNIEETEYPSRQEKIQKELDTCIQVFKEIQSEVKDEDIVETFRIGIKERMRGAHLRTVMRKR